MTRTFFSRTARGEEWWEAFVRGDDVPESRPAAVSTAAAPTRTPAYDALASLGRTDPRMTLSAADCARLEPLAATWLARDADPGRLVQALTSGLPVPVHSPAALARTRLEAKLPPEPVPEARPEITISRLLECVDCGRPGPPAALPGGLCRPCRGEAAPMPVDDPVGIDVHTWAERLRAAARDAKG
ncbi:hypothetical protein [Streptomyces sp. NBRC 110028]|uniref:hypothetical protein n=1 Tax=Streptomyces sp. NBRC 110028 TaxID=1621260 RepID=UPI000B3323E1|nr:hypothetical protein [Streptomyces sp. NBRC 110028]